MQKDIQLILPTTIDTITISSDETYSNLLTRISDKYKIKVRDFDFGKIKLEDLDIWKDEYISINVIANWFYDKDMFITIHHDNSCYLFRSDARISSIIEVLERFLGTRNKEIWVKGGYCSRNATYQGLFGDAKLYVAYG